MSISKGVIYWVLLAVVSLSLGCSLFKKSKPAEETTTAEKEQQQQSPIVDVPWDTSARDDQTAPILRVAVLPNGADGVAVPYLYGYPLYAGGEASRGVLKLRQDNWADAQEEQFEDPDGVVHYTESLPQIGCAIEGIKETEEKFIPFSLSCEVPAPNALGGAKRPVLGELKAGARAADILKEPSIRKAFYGEWHLTSDNFDAEEGIGYFNTESGLLAFGFKRGKLGSIVFLFDTAEKRWQEPTLWIKP